MTQSSQASPPPSSDALERELRAHRDARAARLTSESGWLTVIGKQWLEPGVHRLGSAPGSAIVLPPDRAPALIGELTVRDGSARLEAAEGIIFKARGGEVRSILLRSDAEPEPDQVRFGSLTFELIRRGDDLALRVRDAKSARRAAFEGIPAYPFDPSFRMTARFEPFEAGLELTLADGDGRPQLYTAPGELVFEREGARRRLLPVLEGDRPRMFVVFRDATSGRETYGAGRFLYTPLPEDGAVLLDFNKAFNPPCAFSPFTACPLPPPENHLPFRVEAGEKAP